MKTVAYFGPGDLLPDSLNGPRLRADVKYICFELCNTIDGQLSLGTLAELPEAAKISIDFRDRSAVNTDLWPASVDEVHIYNVLSDPSFKDQKKMLKEAARIVSSKGWIFIGETRTPHYWPIEKYSKIPHKVIFSQNQPSILRDDFFNEFVGGGYSTVWNKSVSEDSYALAIKKYNILRRRI